LGPFAKVPAREPEFAVGGKDLVAVGVRGDGGILLNNKNERFMFDYIPERFAPETADTEEEAHNQCRQLAPTLRYYNKGFPEKTSVLSTGIYVLKVEDHKPKEYPEVKPHYE